MEVYKKIVDEKKLKEILLDIKNKERLLDGKNIIVYREEILDELYNLLNPIFTQVKENQKKIYKFRNNKENIEYKTAKIRLSWNREYLRSLIDNLTKYKEILDLVYVGRINSLWLYKILDKNEFDSKLDMDSDLLNFLSSWMDDNLNKKDKKYLSYLIELRNIMHDIDLKISN